MADVVPSSTQQEFWRSPAGLESAADVLPPTALPRLADACADCGSEYLIGAKFCHTCGKPRLGAVVLSATPRDIAGMLAGRADWLITWTNSAASYWREFSLPRWLRYLHFHEIKRGVGLPTAPFIAFLLGLGCIAGAIGVSLFYKASNLAEFQAIQMWRLEWLLAAAASFLAGILLKKPSSDDPD